jgi:hypothetical protein
LPSTFALRGSAAGDGAQHVELRRPAGREDRCPGAGGGTDERDRQHRTDREGEGVEARGAEGEALARSCLGFVLGDLGEVEAAAASHRAALAIGVAADLPAARALGLEGVAAGVAGVDATAAARLLGAAEQLWDAAVGAPSHEEDRARLRAVLVEALGDDVFAAKVAAGRALPPADALALATTTSF